MALYVCAGSDLTLTPLIAHDVLGQSPGIYGTLLAAIGLGSVAGGAVLSRAHRHRVADNAVLLACAVCGGVALLLLSQAREPVLACLALALVGASTLIQLATLNAAAQLLLPEAIRGRGLAIYMAATFGCMAVASLMWGTISDVFGIEAALQIGAAFFGLAAVAGRFLPIAAVTPPEPSTA